MPVKSQITSADLILINKVDKALTRQIDEIKEDISSINPHAVIKKTTYCKIQPSWLEEISQPSLQRGAGMLKKKPLGNLRVLVKLKKTYSKGKLIQWAEGILDVLYRIKGFVKLDEGWYYIDGTHDGVELTMLDEDREESYVVILSGGDRPVRKAVKAKWLEVFGEEIDL